MKIQTESTNHFKINDMIVFNFFHYIGIGRIAKLHPLLAVELIYILDLTTGKLIRDLGWGRDTVRIDNYNPLFKDDEYLFMDFEDITLLNDEI